MPNTSTSTRPLSESLDAQLRNVRLDEELRSTFDEIAESCPRFRILLLGRSGVGKSALITAVFGGDVEGVKVEHSTKAGVSDIDKEIILPQNSHLVLHDSQGFQHGDSKNFDTVLKFIRERSSETLDLKDRLHAIWLCLEIPAYGGALLETADEKILSLDDLNGKVPIIVVFTKFDIPFTKAKRRLGKTIPQDKIVGASKIEADRTFCETYRESLRKLADRPSIKVSVKPAFRDTLDDLVSLTQNQMSETLAIIWATAQRPSIDLKIDASIKIGRKRYWRGLSSSLNLPGHSLAKWLNVVHKDIVDSWGFHDPNQLLKHKQFKKRMSDLQDDLLDENKRLLGNKLPLGAITATAAVVSGLIPPSAPFAIPIATGLVFSAWVYDVIKATPQVLRGMMGYIVDLTIVMQSLFWLSEAQNQAVSRNAGSRGASSVQFSKRLVAVAFKAYATDGQSRHVHEDIRKFVTPLTALKPDLVLDKIVELIQEHRFSPSNSFRERVVSERLDAGSTETDAEEDNWDI